MVVSVRCTADGSYNPMCQQKHPLEKQLAGTGAVMHIVLYSRTSTCTATGLDLSSAPCGTVPAGPAAAVMVMGSCQPGKPDN